MASNSSSKKTTARRKSRNISDPHKLKSNAQSPKNPHVPPKRPDQGSYNHVQFCPIWTDPNWQDVGPDREKTDFKLKDNVFDRLRPALLPQDQVKRPTEYAHRFGIFPGRSDGRSRTSPTRAESRYLFPADTDIKTGKQLFARFEELARRNGEHVDDYMARTRPDMQHMGEIEQQYMQQYEDLVVDENWQNLLFGSLTMDELQAEGYFPRCDVELDALSGPLYSWVDARRFGKKAEEPRVMYSLDGHREEWDPRVRATWQKTFRGTNILENNDRVWEAMQPALQLATRFLMVDDAFIKGLQDITNRCLVDQKEFLPEEEKSLRIKFSRELDPEDPTRLVAARRLANTGNFDAWKHSWTSLSQIFEIKLRSGFYNEGKRDEHVMGRTTYGSFFSSRDKITVEIDAELVWPLLIDKYSKGEKMLASIVLASTLAHEMMVLACEALDLELMDDSERPEEPYYEDDPVAEVGHAFESHVLGGGYWPFIHATMSLRKPALLQTLSGLVAYCLWPEGLYNEPQNLEMPCIREVRLNHFVRLADVQKYFTHAFWDVAIHKYGTAALREPSTRPHKITFHPLDYCFESHSFEDVTLGTEEDKEWICDFLHCFQLSGNNVLEGYLNNIVNEACDFDLMIQRFKDDRDGWIAQDKSWSDLSKEALMIICEFTAYSIQTCDDSVNEDNIPKATKSAIEFFYYTWENARYGLNRFPDHQSFLCGNYAVLDGLSWWAAQVQRSDVESYENRLIPKISDLLRIVERELSNSESMICELYQLGTTYWPLYFLRAPEHIRDWRIRVKNMETAIGNIVTAMQATDRGIKVCHGGWDIRLLVIGRRIQDISRLLYLDPLSYEADWRDLLVAMPMLRKSHRKPHQRWYFLAKKEMMNLTGKQLEDMKEFKRRFHHLLNLGTYKVVIPGMDPDELSIAQRLSGTLNDDKYPISRPSTDIFHVEGVKKLVARLAKEEKDAQDAKIKRAAGDSAVDEVINDLPDTFTNLQGAAAAQATQAPAILPKIQQMSVHSHAVPLSALPTLNVGSAPFAPYSSGQSPLFPSHQPNEPSAWIANNPVDLAALANQPLGGTPVAHGIMPHPYAVRETVTEDLQNTAEASLPVRDPITFANEFPRDIVDICESAHGAGPLGDVDQMWQQQAPLIQEQSDRQSQESRPVQFQPSRLFVTSMGRAEGPESKSDADRVDPPSFGFRAMTACGFGHSGSDTELSDSGEWPLTREGSDTTLVEFMGTDEETVDSGSKVATVSSDLKDGDRRRGLKRKQSWTPVSVKKQRLEVSGAEKRDSLSKLRNGDDFQKEKQDQGIWGKLISSFKWPRM
ncbi:hypothetical protein F66182_1962 [Fusarium sp. NRRL 66182]|nr:hypothetical protein F66182_1962 [Fusarium sp. NRRL 66182]